MWYPELEDVRNVHERIASLRGQEGGVRDPAALERALRASRQAGGEAPSEESLSEESPFEESPSEGSPSEESPSEESSSKQSLSKKAVALIVPIVRDRPFECCNEQTAFALTMAFLSENGATFQGSLVEMDELFRQIRKNGSAESSRLSSWLEPRLKT